MSTEQSFLLTADSLPIAVCKNKNMCAAVVSRTGKNLDKKKGLWRFATAPGLLHKENHAKRRGLNFVVFSCSVNDATYAGQVIADADLFKKTGIFH